MLRIVTHIERLLLVHDCVIVPKFGGFVLQAVPAVQHMEEHTFRPLRKEIGFNMTLQHNDGLLPESYMQMYAVSYRQAGADAGRRCGGYEEHPATIWKVVIRSVRLVQHRRRGADDFPSG